MWATAKAHDFCGTWKWTLYSPQTGPVSTTAPGTGTGHPSPPSTWRGGGFCPVDVTGGGGLPHCVASQERWAGSENSLPPPAATYRHASLQVVRCSSDVFATPCPSTTIRQSVRC